MMNLLSRWLSRNCYQSLLWFHSETYPGVEFSLRRVSLAQRIELLSRVRELVLKNEFLQAGHLPDQLEATRAELLTQKLYVEWAVTAVRGLRIDGHQCSVSILLEDGPPSLVAEIYAAIRQHLELSEDERKNF